MEIKKLKVSFIYDDLFGNKYAIVRLHTLPTFGTMDLCVDKSKLSKRGDSVYIDAKVIRDNLYENKTALVGVNHYGGSTSETEFIVYTEDLI